MKVLGISAYFHDSSMCLVVDGEIIFAAQEERYTRIKNDASFPLLAIQKCIEYTNVKLTDIDYVIYYEKPFLKLERILNSYLLNSPKGLRSFIAAMHAWTNQKLFIKQEIYKELKKIDPGYNKYKQRLLFSEHHLSHAASAFYPSPFTQSAILCIDGVGEYTTTSLLFGDGKSINLLKEIHFPHSLGLFYSAVTYFLGFKVNCDEYKVMGLASYGNKYDKETQDFISVIQQELISFTNDGAFRLNMKQFAFEHSLKMVDDKSWAKLFGIQKRDTDAEIMQSHCNLAYAFQKITETIVINLATELRRITRSDNLCLAGGVALNSVINGILIDKHIFKNVFIAPPSGDAGGSLGAALLAYHKYAKMNRVLAYPDSMKQSLLGCEADENQIELLSKQHENVLICYNEDELCEKTAEFIANGKVVGWFQGRMEFGPRALGNRSILADPRDENMQLHLNLKIKNRESFRPFAPAVLLEDVDKYFDYKGHSPYMLQVHSVKKTRLHALPDNYNKYSIREKLYFVKSSIPAVTHVDLSARIQTVDRSQHPLFWKLINSFKAITGCSLVINTSFNVKDEPIVCTPADAYRCFISTGMDILVMNKTIFYK